MQIRRDYSLYGRKRRSHGLRILLIMLIEAVVISAFVFLLTTRYADLQVTALQAVGMAPPATPYASAYAREGAEKFRAGDLDGASAALLRAVQQQPQNVAYLYEYGRVLIEMGNYDEAAVIADRALGADPNDVRGYALKANALAWSAPDTAVTTAVTGTAIDNTFAPLYGAQAIAYTNIGRYQAALDAGARAVELDPMDGEVRRAYAVPLTFTGRYQEAIAQYEQAIAINPNLTGAFFQLAGEYRSLRTNRPEMAIAIYEHVINEMNTSSAEEARANLRLCETYQAIQYADFGKAEVYCLRALEIDPNYGAAYGALGTAQYSRRNYEGAIESFERCAELGADYIQCWSLRGLAHYWLANCDEAWEVLTEARERAIAGEEAPETIDTINTGLFNVTQSIYCPAYRSIPTPTTIPPTIIPPTPIGGL